MKNIPLPADAIPFLMSQQDLRELGMQEVGYVKKYKMNGKIAFVLHAADGTALAVQDDASSALNSARHQDLDLVSVH